MQHRGNLNSFSLLVIYKFIDRCSCRNNSKMAETNRKRKQFNFLKIAKKIDYLRPGWEIWMITLAYIHTYYIKIYICNVACLKHCMMFLLIDSWLIHFLHTQLHSLLLPSLNEMCEYIHFFIYFFHKVTFCFLCSCYLLPLEHGSNIVCSKNHSVWEELCILCTCYHLSAV